MSGSWTNRVGKYLRENVSRIGYITVVVSVSAILIYGGVLRRTIPVSASVRTGGHRPPLPTLFVAAQDSNFQLGRPNEMGFAAVVKKVLPAVVNISSSRMVQPQASPFFNDPFFQKFFGGQLPQQGPQRQVALGSGVIVSPDGYIMTNNHVIEKATEIKVFLPDKQEYPAKVVGTDTKTDIAILKIAATNLPVVVFGDSSKLQVGDYALAIGDPLGVGETVTMGIISATARSGLDIENYEDFIQTDAAINPGNSGGALINARGELIGINTAILTEGSGGNEGIGFAIPINMARYVMEQILKYGKVTRGALGVVIQDITPPLAKVYGVPANQGAIIGNVEPDSAAAKAGLQRGDVIAELNGQLIQGANDLKLKIGEMRPGTTVKLKIVRNGTPREVTVTLGEQNKGELSAGGGTGEQQQGLMQGVQVENLTPEICQQIGVPVDTKGVVVTQVAQGSAAESSGLQPKDIIQQVERHPVDNVSEYERQIGQAGNQQIVLLVDRGGTSMFLVVQQP